MLKITATHRITKALRIFSFIVLCYFCINFDNQALAQKNYDVLTKWYPYQTLGNNATHKHIVDEAIVLLDRRAASVQKINSVKDWKQKQKSIKKVLMSAIGALPEKTPLNAKITEVIQKAGFRVEHVLFESMPGFFVTSSLFIPNSVKEKAPTIVYCSGHSASGYRSKTYQVAILNLVKKGFVVFAYDPVGQGERLEYPNENNNKSLVGASTREHDLPGVQAFITGVTPAKYMVWDGIRALDYLLTRKEVDSKRIGMTGRSGGGLQSAFIGALDDRIMATAPECYMTTMGYMMQSNRTPDAEQNTLNFVGLGLDKPDLLLARAPKPTLMITTTNDIFNIQGARDTHQEVSRIYKAMGESGNFAMVEDVAVHASTLKNREAMYAFFQKHLKNPGNEKEDAVPFLSSEELQVTTTGQVLTSLHGKTIFSMHAEYSEILEDRLKESRKNLPVHSKKIIEDSKRLSGYREPVKTDKTVLTGVVYKNGIRVEKYFVKGEGEYVIPYLLFIPKKANTKAIIYLSPKGKASAIEDGTVDSLARAGFHVMVPDLIGTGELGPGQWMGGDYFQHAKIEGLSYDIWYAAMLIGRSIVGVRAGDIAKLAYSLKSQGMTEIGAVAIGVSAQPLLHAAAYTDDISRVALLEPYISYKALVSERFYDPNFIEGAVASALQSYEIADLVASIAPRKLVLTNATDAKGKALSLEYTEKVLSIAVTSYDESTEPTNLYILSNTTAYEAMQKFTKDWVK